MSTVVLFTRMSRSIKGDHQKVNLCIIWKSIVGNICQSISYINMYTGILEFDNDKGSFHFLYGPPPPPSLRVQEFLEGRGGEEVGVISERVSQSASLIFKQNGRFSKGVVV